MAFSIQNSLGTIELATKVIFPKLTWDDFRKRVSSLKRFGQDGEELTGDEFADARQFSLDYNIIPSSALTIAQKEVVYTDILNSIAGFFTKRNKPFYILDDELNRRSEIVLSRMSDRPMSPGLLRVAGTGSLKLKWLDAYWEDITETIETTPSGGIANGETLDVDNDSDFDAFPIIVLETPLGSNSDFLIRNNTTGDQLVFGSSNFVPGSTLTINSITGKIELFNGITTIDGSFGLSDGSGFISLQPGVNEILYESAFFNVDMTIKWRQRYAF